MQAPKHLRVLLPTIYLVPWEEWKEADHRIPVGDGLSLGLRKLDFLLGFFGSSRHYLPLIIFLCLARFFTKAEPMVCTCYHWVFIAYSRVLLAHTRESMN